MGVEFWYVILIGKYKSLHWLHLVMSVLSVFAAGHFRAIFIIQPSNEHCNDVRAIFRKLNSPLDTFFPALIKRSLKEGGTFQTILVNNEFDLVRPRQNGGDIAELITGDLIKPGIALAVEAVSYTHQA